MKTVITLSVLQLLVILFLLMKVMGIDERPGQAMAPAENNVATARSSNSPEVVATEGNKCSFDAGLLREIVREELRAQMDSLLPGGVDSPGGVHSDSKQVSDTVSEAEYRYRLDAALQNLEYYIQQGEISDAEMAELQANIGGLDQQGRKQMLSLLAKALSSGDLKGHF